MNKNQSSRCGGFAIIISLGVLAFVLLLLLSIITFVQVESRVASDSLNRLEAKQNALLALNLAIGELQLHTGPDQRVTATADIELPDSVTVENTTTGGDAKTLLDTYWQDRRSRHWTGVWSDSDAGKDAFDKEDLPASNPVPTLESWLVSQTSMTTVDPSDQIVGLAANSQPGDELSVMHLGQVVPARMLVGGNDGSLTRGQVLERVVVAPQVAVDSTDAVGGNFAWWIGDEGVKARADLRDPYDHSSASADEMISRYQTAQRVAIEAMTGDGAPEFKDLSSFDQTNEPELDIVSSLNQLELLSALTQKQLSESYHDLTLYSSGVLSDVRNGGLKYDLSRVLSADDENAFQEVIGSVFDVSMDSNFNVLLDPKFSPYATVPSNPSGTSGKGSYSIVGDLGDFMKIGATWEQLYSYFNMKNSTGAAPEGVFFAPDVVEMREASETEVGVYPLITHAKIFYELAISDGTVWVHSIPLVVVANPYNVDMHGSFEVEIFRATGPGLRVYFGVEDNPAEASNDPDDYTFSTSGYVVIDELGLGGVNLVIDDVTIPAGEAQVFMLADDVVDFSSSTENASMINDFLDPTSHRILHDTGEVIESQTVNGNPATHAALKVESISMGARLKIITNDVVGSNRYSQFKGKDPWPDNEESINKTEYVVYPISTTDTLRRGAGLVVTRQDPIAQLNPTQRVQQSLFYQMNYRGYASGAVGFSTGNIFAPGKMYIRPGEPGNENRFEDHLMLGGAVDNFTQVRWGLVNNGRITNPTVAPAPVDQTEIAHLYLYDLPRAEHPLSSLGQLQHFNLSGQPSNNPKEQHYAYSFQVNYPTSNSYPHPRVYREMTFSTTQKTGPHWDASYMMNRILYDRFFFSSYPAAGDFNFNEDTLINSRLEPFRSTDLVALDDVEKFRGSGLDDTEDSLRAAENLMVSGAFNVNSTSVNAWKAILSSLRGVLIGSETDPAELTAPFARTLYQTGGHAGSQDSTQSDAWAGFVNLSQDQIDAIAEEMVLEVQKRGPFMSMADFTNRLLIESDDDIYDLGLGGALQSAIDTVVNQRASLVSPFDAQSAPSPNATFDGKLADPEYRMPSILSGAPGYLLQADVLSALEPVLAARSDTFVIRTYGDATNPVSGEAVAQVWCEAVVQRFPDYVSPVESAIEMPASSINSRFGRGYKVLSFRWLSADEL